MPSCRRPSNRQSHTVTLRSMIARTIASACAGFFLAISFPRPGISFLAWVAFVPIITIAARSDPIRSLFYGFIFGGTFFITLVYWIYSVLAIHTSMGTFLSIVVLFLLISYLSLFPSIFAYLLSQTIRLYGGRAIFVSPFIWVALELLRNYALSGFPWGIAGYTQSSVTPLIQIASVTGVYGLSFLIVLINASVAYLLIEYVSLRKLIPLAASVLFALALMLWGFWRMSAPLQGETAIDVSCIQGNYSGNMSEGSDENLILTDYIHMTAEAAAEGSTLVIWPETITSFEVCCTKDYAELLGDLCRKLKIGLILGSAHEVREKAGTKYFNSAFHIRADGKIGDRYDKMHLVPYGEYVPLPGLLFFVRRFVEASSDFSKGNRYAIMDHGKGDFAVLICYEVIFPESVRQFAKRGATFFVNITNDAWFGRSSAPYQHFDFVKLRAVESGRYFVRCAGTGISGIVSPYGDVLKSTGIFSKEIVTGSIEPLEHRTLYSRTGDLFAFACVIMTVILISPLVSKRSKLSTSSGEGKSED